MTNASVSVCQNLHSKYEACIMASGVTIFVSFLSLFKLTRNTVLSRMYQAIAITRHQLGGFVFMLFVTRQGFLEQESHLVARMQMVGLRAHPI